MYPDQQLSLQLVGLRVAAVGLIAIGIFATFYVLASAPTGAASALGLRGLKRTRVLQKNEAWGGFEPFVRWLGARVRGMIPDDLRARMDQQIALAGDFMGITADEYAVLSLISLVGGIAAGWILGIVSDQGSVLILPFGLLGAALPYMQISGAAAERLKNISRGLPYVIDLMALAMGAGLDFPGAVRQVIDKSANPDDPLVEECMLILQTLNLGRTRKEALVEFARRAPIEVVKEFTGSVIQAEERGNPVAEVLLIQAAASRNRRSVRAEELAAKASVKIVGPLMLIFFCIMAMILGPALMSISAGLS